MHFSEGGYDRVAQQFLVKLDVDVFYVSCLEQERDRSVKV